MVWKKNFLVYSWKKVGLQQINFGHKKIYKKFCTKLKTFPTN